MWSIYTIRPFSWAYCLNLKSLIVQTAGIRGWIKSGRGNFTVNRFARTVSLPTGLFCVHGNLKWSFCAAKMQGCLWSLLASWLLARLDCVGQGCVLLHNPSTQTFTLLFLEIVHPTKFMCNDCQKKNYICNVCGAAKENEATGEMYSCQASFKIQYNSAFLDARLWQMVSPPMSRISAWCDIWRWTCTMSLSRLCYMLFGESQDA